MLTLWDLSCARTFLLNGRVLLLSLIAIFYRIFQTYRYSLHSYLGLKRISFLSTDYTSSLEDLLYGTTMPTRVYYCCTKKCFKTPTRLRYAKACDICNENVFCMCECDSYQHNKWGDPETACRKCWNRYIEECGCGGLAEASPKLNEKTKYCCPEKCSVLSGEHIEGMKCLVCGIEGYCMCRCVMHRLSRYQPQEILEEYQVYEITEIGRHFIEPPLFYNPTECPLKYRYRPFYFLKLKFTHSRKGVQGTVYIPLKLLE